jgi:DNA-binding XRE family transcriptional regulator
MDKAKRKRLEAKGWKVGSVAEFLGLTPEEEAIIGLRLALSNAVKRRRQAANLTQEAFAKKLRTSQSRLAKMEAGDKSVSFDLLIKSLLSSGEDVQGIGKVLINSAAKSK